VGSGHYNGWPESPRPSAAKACGHGSRLAAAVVRLLNLSVSAGMGLFEGQRQTR